MPAVSVVVVAYGRTPLLPQVIDAVLRSEGVDVEIIVVDNGSTDDTVAGLPSDDRLAVLHPGESLGVGGGCNAGAAKARSDLIAFVNPDAIVDSGAVAELAAALADPAAAAPVGIATARVRLLREPELLNSSGGVMHFLGLGWAGGFREPAASATEPRPVMGASGAAMMIRADVMRKLGGFAEPLFLYHEDLELSVHAWLAGFQVVYTPTADVFHDYEFSRNKGKLYYLERNRHLLMLTCFERRTLLLLAPAALVFEVGMVALAAAQGWLGEKLAGWGWIATHRRWIRARRREIQTTRVRRDRELVPMIAARFEGGQVAMPD